MTKKQKKTTNIVTTEKKSKNYFTKEHENAIVQYALTSDNKIRTQLYIKFIRPVFDELVDKIIYTYKFNTLPNIESISEDCKVFLTTILDKYNPEKSKAFSYFTVVAKHWFIHKAKEHSKSLRVEQNFEGITEEVERSGLIDDGSKAPRWAPYEQFREDAEFWMFLSKEIDTWDNKISLKENDKKVYEAVKIILNSKEELETFDKRAIYLYLREITKLSTKQIVNSLNKMKKLYKEFRKKWNDGKI